MDKFTDLNVAIKGSLLFALGFLLAGYAAQYAIILGLLGGLVAGFITVWSNTKEVRQSSANPEGENIIRSVKKIGQRIVKLGADGKPTQSSTSEEESEHSPSDDSQVDVSALNKTKPKPEMGWFGVKHTRKSRR